jgi:hypothetical protein
MGLVLLEALSPCLYLFNEFKNATIGGHMRPGRKNNCWKNIRMSLPYLKDVLLSLHKDVVVYMKGMSSSSSRSYIRVVLDSKLSSKTQHNLVFPSS